MPLNEIPRHFNPETRNLIEAALEDAWPELNKDGDHHIGHRPIRELPRSQRFTQEKQQVLVTRVVVKGLVEALDCSICSRANQAHRLRVTCSHRRDGKVTCRDLAKHHGADLSV